MGSRQACSEDGSQPPACTSASHPYHEGPLALGSQCGGTTCLFNICTLILHYSLVEVSDIFFPSSWSMASGIGNRLFMFLILMLRCTINSYSQGCGELHFSEALRIALSGCCDVFYFCRAAELEV